MADVSMDKSGDLPYAVQKQMLCATSNWQYVKILYMNFCIVLCPVAKDFFILKV